MAEKNNLRLFCEYILQKYKSMEYVSTELLSDEFRNIFLDKVPLSPATLAAVAASLGIGVTAAATPHGLRGYNDIYEGKMNIYYKEDDCRSGKENTILHEMREIMETYFAELQYGYAPLRTSAVHNEANRFAGAVLLPYEQFKRKVLETGLDVLALCDLYSKSCSQIIIRMAEVLRGDMFFYGALYQLQKDYDSQYVLTCWSASARDDSLLLPSHLFPRRGHSIIAESAVDAALKRKKPCLVDRIVISADNVDSDITAMAQPIMLNGIVSHVVLTAILRQDRNIFEAQIERIQPFTIARFDGHL